MKKFKTKSILGGGYNRLNKTNDYPNLKLKKLFPCKVESEEIA